MGKIFSQTIWKRLANMSQFFIPVLCLIGAGMSTWQRNRKQNLFPSVAQSRFLDALDSLSRQEFEILVGECFRLQGYQVMETGGNDVADDGVDLILRKTSKSGDEKFFVQCKRWRTFKVGVTIVRELDGVMAARGAVGGFVITSGSFTEDAISFAKGLNVTLIDWSKLYKMIKQVKGGPEISRIKFW